MLYPCGGGGLKPAGLGSVCERGEEAGGLHICKYIYKIFEKVAKI